MRNICKNISSRPTGLSCRFCWNDSACLSSYPTPVAPLNSCLSLPATTIQLFSQNLFPTFFAAVVEFLNFNNLCIFWRSKFQQVRTDRFCSWNDLFAQNWKSGSPNNLCTESLSTLTTNTSAEWNFYLS